MAAKKKKVFVLLDAHGLMYRAFHALPPLTSPQGQPVGAVYGVANILLKIIKDLKPDYIAAAFDRPEQTFRHEAYEAYKAQREKAPDDLIKQFETTRELMEAFGIRVYDRAGYEADDVIGTIVREARKKDGNTQVIVASGDMDTIQLVDGEKVVVFTMRKGIADTVLYDEKTARERFGFAPELLPDFKGLRGDPSDNIKGVLGIGEKTASILVAQFGSLEHIYAALKKKNMDGVVTPRIAALLTEHKDDAFFSRDLARIRQDVPLSFTLTDTAWDGFNPAKAGAFLASLNFKSMISRLPNTVRPEAMPLKQEMLVESTFESGKRETDTREFFVQARHAKEIAWVGAEDGAVQAAIGASVWVFDTQTLRTHADDFNALFSASTRHVYVDGKVVLKMLWRAGVLSARVDADTRIGAWVLDPTERLPVAGGVETVCEEAAAQEQALKKQKLLSVYTDIEIPLISVLARMEEAGVLVDVSVLKEFSRTLTARIKERETTIYKLAGTQFNISSPKQLGEVLFEKLGIATDGIRNTGGGAKSTRASELAKMRGAHPVVEEILAYREEAKLQSTYVDVLPGLVNPATGRIHATFNQIGAVTGRLSSQDPNMQNIPIRTPLGRELRKAFVAPAGYDLVSCDYSQVELRLAAVLSGDANMIRVFADGGDIHTTTAAAINNVQESDVTPTMRRAAKTINFGILYGMGAMSLAEAIGVSRKEAQMFIDQYFKKFPGVKAYLSDLKTQAEKRGYVETLFGRRRYFKNITSLGWQARREAERMAINAPIQGSEADIIKIAMVHVDTELAGERAAGVVRMVLQVHDELLFEIKKEEREHLGERIANIMRDVTTLAVPLKVDIKHGPNWYALGA